MMFQLVNLNVEAYDEINMYLFGIVADFARLTQTQNVGDALKAIDFGHFFIQISRGRNPLKKRSRTKNVWQKNSIKEKQNNALLKVSKKCSEFPASVFLLNLQITQAQQALFLLY